MGFMIEDRLRELSIEKEQLYGDRSREPARNPARARILP